MLILSLITLVIMITGLSGAFVYARKREKSIRNEVQAYYQQIFVENEESPSQFQLFANAWVENISDRLLLRFKQSLGAYDGQINRQERELTADIAEEVLARENPLVAAAIDMMPSVKKRIRKNPAALPALISLITKNIGAPGKSSWGISPGSAGPAGPAGSNNKQRSFDLG